MKFSRKILPVFLVLFSILFFCKNNTTDNQPSDDTNIREIPVYTEDGWEISSLQKENIDSVLIKDMVDKITANEYENVNSVVIIKNGKLVFEVYFPGYDLYGEYINYSSDVIHHLASCTKSFTSALIGIAFDKGYLSSLDQKLYDFFPEYHHLEWEGSKKRIEIGHMLTMSAGLFWDESTYSLRDPRNTHFQMNTSGNPIKFVLELPVISEPGRTFHYSSGISVLIG